MAERAGRVDDGSPGLAAQWIGLLGAPAVFFAHLQLGYVVVYWACRYHTNLWTHVVGVGSVLLGASCTAVAWHVWERTGRDAPGEGGGAVPRARFLGVTGLGVSAFLVLLLVSVIAGCSGGEGEARRAEAAALTGGDPLRGPALMRKYGCASCHAIPGVPGADGLVGPPLAGIASRAYVGVLTNTPERMIRWIEDPKRVDSLTPMPNVGMTEPDARRIAAYLYTLR